MSKRPFLFVLLMLSCAMLMLLFVPVAAQDATPTAVPTPVATLEPPPNCPVFQNESKDIRTSYYMGKGFGFMTSGLLNDAILSFTCVIRVIDSSYVPAYMMRATAYVREQEFERAIQDYTKVTQLEPTVLDAFNNRGIVYVAVKDYERAQRDFDKVLEIDGKSILGLNNRSVLYAVLGDYDNAINLLQKAIDISGIANVYAELTDPKRPPDAKPIQFDPLNARAYALLGVMYSARALDNYQKYLFLTGGNGDGRIQSAAGALQSQFTFDMRLDSTTWLLVANFSIEGS
jgi:tetratricopeptide (TPR) repeat protein